jgi:hypothetical protein
MAREPKGYWDRSGKKIERDKPLATKTGMVIYKGRGDSWVIDYPDMKQYGAVNTIKLMTLIYHLGQGKNLDDSRQLSGLLIPDDL